MGLGPESRNCFCHGTAKIVFQKPNHNHDPDASLALLQQSAYGFQTARWKYENIHDSPDLMLRAGGNILRLPKLVLLCRCFFFFCGGGGGWGGGGGRSKKKKESFMCLFMAQDTS